MSMLKAATIKIMTPLQCCMVDKKLNELSDEEEWIGDQVTVYKVPRKERQVPQQVLSQTSCQH